MTPDPSLPLDGRGILALAARSMFDLFANAFHPRGRKGRRQQPARRPC
jgi:hypothetical protein